MTIAQRIELRRLGYSKDEISELAELENVPAPETEPAGSNENSAENVSVPETPPEPVPASPDVQTELLKAINNLTIVLQNQKLNNTPQPETKTETTQDIFNSILKG